MTFLIDVLDDVLADLFLVDVGVVLRRDDDRVDADRAFGRGTRSVTCDFASGRRYGISFGCFLRMSARRFTSLCAYMIGIGMYSGRLVAVA